MAFHWQILSHHATQPSCACMCADLQRFDGPWFWQQALVMASASAVLGPLCDGQHSSHNVLHYANPAHLALGPLQLETCW